jgi:hypothetical protein
MAFKLTQNQLNNIIDSIIENALGANPTPDLNIKCILLRKMTKEEDSLIHLANTYYDEVEGEEIINTNMKYYELVSTNYTPGGKIVGELELAVVGDSAYLTIVDAPGGNKIGSVSWEDIYGIVSGVAFYSVETGNVITYSLNKPTTDMVKDNIQIELSKNGQFSYLIKLNANME